MPQKSIKLPSVTHKLNLLSASKSMAHMSPLMKIRIEKIAQNGGTDTRNYSTVTSGFPNQRTENMKEQNNKDTFRETLNPWVTASGPSGFS